MENTGETFNRINDFTKISYQRVNDRINNGDIISVGHTIAGNRARMARVVKLNADYQWRESLSIRDKKKFDSFAGWLLSRYGYDRQIDK